MVYINAWIAIPETGRERAQRRSTDDTQQGNGVLPVVRLDGVLAAGRRQRWRLRTASCSLCSADPIPATTYAPSRADGSAFNRFVRGRAHGI